MSLTINIHEAKTHFSRYLLRVLGGEEIVIAKAGTPVARLVPYQQAKTQRVPGSAQGLIQYSTDLNAPLPAELLAAFEGEDSGL
ncbi:MAG: type II toxin-antitoxin system Phd/YefM family antitoxin [Caldilineaceae bacterium]